MLSTRAQCIRNVIASVQKQAAKVRRQLTRFHSTLLTLTRHVVSSVIDLKLIETNRAVLSSWLPQCHFFSRLV